MQVFSRIRARLNMGEKVQRIKVWDGPDSRGRYVMRWIEVSDIAPAAVSRDGSVTVFQQPEEPDALPGDIWIEEE